MIPDPTLQNVINVIMSVGGAGAIVSAFLEKTPYVSEWYDSVGVTKNPDGTSNSDYRPKILVIAVLLAILVGGAVYVGQNGGALTFPIVAQAISVWFLNIIGSQIYHAYVNQKMNLQKTVITIPAPASGGQSTVNVQQSTPSAVPPVSPSPVLPVVPPAPTVDVTANIPDPSTSTITTPSPANVTVKTTTQGS